MGIFFWRDNKKHDEFARTLADEFIKRFPNDAAHSVPNRKNRQQLDKVIINLHAKASNYSQEYNLGLYSKARVANTFKWSLKEAGYNPEFIDDITKDIVKTMSVKGANQ